MKRERESVCERMADEGKKAEEKAAASAAAASPAKEGVDLAAAAGAVGGGSDGGAGDGTDEAEGEDDGEPCPKVSSRDQKVNSALKAARGAPYAKPQGEAPNDDGRGARLVCFILAPPFALCALFLCVS